VLKQLTRVYTFPVIKASH